MNLIEVKKAAFLDKYNPKRSVNEGLAKAINAAVQRNLLYSETVNFRGRAEIRGYWRDRLFEAGKQFRKDVSVREYEVLIEGLKSDMNLRFKDAFLNGNHYGSMFRVSHAQKSIAVFIKHLWCLGDVGEPRICPVDRVVLRATNAKRNDDLAWGCVNSIEDHRRKFGYIEDAAERAGLSVARWELINFS